MQKRKMVLLIFILVAVFFMGAGYAQGRTDPGLDLRDAAVDGKLKVVKSLVAKGAPINSRDRNGSTALNLAAENGHADVVLFLLDKGADPDAANNDGYTPLMWAAIHEDADMVETLIEHGADVNYASDEGLSALMIADFGGLEEIVAILVDAGAEEYADAEYEDDDWSYDGDDDWSSDTDDDEEAGMADGFDTVAGRWQTKGSSDMSGWSWKFGADGSLSVMEIIGPQARLPMEYETSFSMSGDNLTVNISGFFQFPKTYRLVGGQLVSTDGKTVLVRSR